MKIEKRWRRATALIWTVLLCFSAVLDSGAVGAEAPAGPETYAVVIENCENGAVVFETSEERGQSYAQGEVVRVKVQPDPGYGLEKLTVAGEKENAIIPEWDGNTAAFSMPDADVVISAVFSAAGEETPDGDKKDEEDLSEDKAVYADTDSGSGVEPEEGEGIPENAAESGGQDTVRDTGEENTSVEARIRQTPGNNLDTPDTLEEDRGTDIQMFSAKAAEKTEIQVKAKAVYQYADYGLGTGRTRQYEVAFEDPETGEQKTVYAYCIQPKKEAPGDCTCVIEPLGGNKLTSRVIYFGTESLSGKDSYWQEGYGVPAMEDGAKWIITHIAASKASGDDDWGYGANSKAVEYAKDLIEYARTCAASFPDAEVSFSPGHVTAYVDTDMPNLGLLGGGRQKTPVITFHGDPNNVVRLTLPDGVSCWENHMGMIPARQENGQAYVEIKGGTSFYFVAGLDQAQKVSSSFKINTYGSIKKTYQTYKLTITYGGGDYQNLGMILGTAVPAGDRELSLEVDWLTVGDLHIEKYARSTQHTDTGERLAGATFNLLDEGGKKVTPTAQNGITGDMDASGLITVRPDGCADVKNLPAGTYSLREITVPVGYRIPEKDSSVDIAPGRENSVLVPNDQIAAGIRIRKYDAETGEAAPQGGGSFANAKFRIVALQDCTVGLRHYSTGDVVYDGLTLDKDGCAETPVDVLTEGRYRLEETEAPSGYLVGGSVEFAITKDDHGKLKDMTNGEVKDAPVRGGIKMKKVDKDTKKAAAQGDASLEGARFEIVNLNEKPVEVDGVKYGRGQVVYTLETDGDGTARTDSRLLPYGTYTLREASGGQPEGYLWNGDMYREFSITQNGVLVDLSAYPMEDPVIRGGVRVSKYDGESGENRPLGGASLENMEIVIYNESREAVYVSGQVYQPGEIVHVMYTDADGCAQTPPDLLPYGSYRLAETAPPEGYMGKDEDGRGVYEGTFTVRRNEELVDMAGGENGLADFVKRGDFSIRKIHADTQKSMAGVAFRITSMTTGEAHTFMTDANGYYSSSSSYTPHTHGTNGGKPRDGIWFGLRPDGTNVEADDSLGALPYDTYRIEELPGENNRGMVMFSDILSITENNKCIGLGTVENKEIAIGTTAKDSVTGTHDQVAGEGACIVDTVFYQNLDRGISYTLKGTLVDRENGEAVKDADGNPISAEKTFRPAVSTGSVDVEFLFDASGLSGMAVVVFEELYEGDKKLAEHKELEDEGQTIRYPRIGTRATDGQTSINVSHAGSEVTLVDTVSYSNLQAGRAYGLAGTLMVKETGEAYVDADGKPATAFKMFVPETPSGTVEVLFSFNGIHAAGQTLVAFEELSRGGQTYAVHTDISDEDQTVYFPEIGTEACVESTGARIAMAEAPLVVTDTVSYHNLQAGQEYRLVGSLMAGETGEALEENGVPVTVENTFVPDTSSGAVDVRFVFNAENLAGSRIVVFEELYMGSWLVASHKDPEDEGQTVYIPGIWTNAVDAVTEEHTACEDEKITIRDTVTYTGLIPGQTYKVIGNLMDQETGEAVTAGGEAVTAEETFQPTETDGAIDVIFQFNGISLGGKTVVAFETLLYNDIEIAAHRDIRDEGQSVVIIPSGAVKGISMEKEKEDTPPKSSEVSHASVQAAGAARTGDTNNILLLGFLGLASLGSLAILIRLFLKKHSGIGLPGHPGHPVDEAKGRD